MISYIFYGKLREHHGMTRTPGIWQVTLGERRTAAWRTTSGKGRELKPKQPWLEDVYRWFEMFWLYGYQGFKLFLVSTCFNFQKHVFGSFLPTIFEFESLCHQCHPSLPDASRPRIIQVPIEKSGASGDNWATLVPTRSLYGPCETTTECWGSKERTYPSWKAGKCSCV